MGRIELDRALGKLDRAGLKLNDKPKGLTGPHKRHGERSDTKVPLGSNKICLMKPGMMFVV